MKTVEELFADRDRAATALTAANRAYKDAEQAVKAAKVEHDAACVAFSKMQPTRFPAGSKVNRSEVRRGSYGLGFRQAKTPDKTVVVRGIVTLCEGATNYRNHYPKPGEWFVLSASGQTAYSLNGDWQLDNE